VLAQFNNRHFYLVLAADFFLFLVAFVGAYLLRFDFSLTPYYRAQILALLPFLVPGKAAIFCVFGLYRGMWRYTGRRELWRLGQAGLVAAAYYVVATSWTHGLPGVPRSVFLLDALLTIILTGGLRLAIRSLYARPLWMVGRKNGDSPRCPGPRPPGKSVLVIGAGDAGEKLCKEILDNPALNYRVLGVLDDDPAKWGRSLHGVKILGGVDRLPEISRRRRIDEVLIAIPSATGSQMRRITELCKRSGLSSRTLPDLADIIEGRVSVGSLRDIKYEDLLRREPVHLEAAEIRQYVEGKTVLVTGAGGSIGAELCRQLCRCDPAELILVDAAEANLYGIQMELQHELGFPRYRCILSRVQDRRLLDRVFSRYRPRLIFHAAAYKHVPLLEENPWKAVTNNVLGSQVVMELALKYRAERFVLVSTDKAVRPTSVMGASKRLTELILQSMPANGVRFMAVRFGNVIGSSGSVLPLFRRQLEKGGPITVTHPEVTRYFMTIPEAAHLILQAGGLGRGGEIFLLEMGTPVKITRMAEELVRLSGKEPGRDVNIVFTGLRPGEKLSEELITPEEDIIPTPHEKILVLRPNGGNGRKLFAHWLDEQLKELYGIAKSHDACAIRTKLCKIIPEYIPEQNIQCIFRSKRVILKDSLALKLNFTDETVFLSDNLFGALSRKSS
jgi:FlaA1/EpsC-like NDP-sugar epimerase